MQSNNFEVYCCNDHPADRICTMKSCTIPAAICREEGCQYSDSHSECQNKIDVKNLIEMLEQKVASNLKEADEVIIDSINKMIKRLEILKQEYLNKGRYSFGLMRESKKVFELLKNGPAAELKPEAANSCIQRISGNSKDQKCQEKKIEELRFKVKSMLQQQSNRLQDVRAFWIGFRFQNLLCNNQRDSVFNEGKSIRKIKFGDSFALMSPSLPSTAKIELRVSKMDSGIAIGVFGKDQLVKSNYNWPQKCKGCFLINSNGHVIHYQNEDQNNRSFQFSFKQGDHLQLEYVEQLNELKVTNLSNTLSHTFSKVSKNGKQLYFGAYSFNKDDQIEIIK